MPKAKSFDSVLNKTMDVLGVARDYMCEMVQIGAKEVETDTLRTVLAWIDSLDQIRTSVATQTVVIKIDS